MALRDEIRTWVLIQGKSQRAASRHFGLSRNTIAKLLLEEPAESVRHYQRQAQPKTPVRDTALSHIQQWLQENEWLERWAPKQCWTAHRMWTELRKLGIPIGESTVRLFVQELRTSSKPAYVPLDFAPGERAEFDFGEATVKLSGQVVKVPFLAGRLRFSGAMFVECFPTQRQEAFLLGQRHAFEFWGGVPRIAVYDNLKPAVLQVLQGHSRREHDVFLHFQSVYRFEALFANIHAGWEKGSVENLVGYARRNYLVPLPERTALEAINADLRACCLSDQQRTMARRTDPIATRLAFERSTLGPLPTHAPELALVVEVLAHSTGRVRFQTNDYSVPIQYAYQHLTLKADPFRVRLYAGEELVADHPRSYEKRQVIEDWRHYVPLLLKKSFAVPWASALRHGDIPPAFEAARLELVAHRADGNREFARLLDLCLTHEVQAVETALAQARAQGGWSADSVRHLLNFASTPHTPVPPLDPSQYPAYQAVTPSPDLSAYNRLLEGAAMTEETRKEIVMTYLKQLRLNRMARDCESASREAEQRGLGYLGYLQSLLEGELAHRQEQQMRQRLKAAAFPYQKRLEDFDFSLIPCVSKVRLLELAQGAFLSSHDNVLFIGPSGIGKTHLLMGLGRALCLSGYRVLFRPAVTLATELEVAHKELRLPRLLASYRRFDLILVDELGYLPFAKATAELLFQFFSDRYERSSVAITSNLAFAQWTQVFGNEQMTAALLDRLVHRSHIVAMEGESFRFRQSLQQQDPQALTV